MPSATRSSLARGPSLLARGMESVFSCSSRGRETGIDLKLMLEPGSAENEASQTCVSSLRHKTPGRVAGFCDQRGPPATSKVPVI